MPKQYGSNGINSDGSLMNVGNHIWDPKNGGKPSIKLFPEKNPMARTTPPWLLDQDQDQKNNKLDNSKKYNKKDS